MSPLVINEQVTIDADELTFTAARASGPGGQNVNKVSSRITLRFDVAGSPSLDDAQRARIRERLPTRITRAGVLWVHAQQHRTQRRNRQAAVERFVTLLQEALHRDPPRKPTKKSRAVQRRRLEGKKRRAQVKAGRRRPRRDD